MNKKTARSGEWSISKMASHLPAEAIPDIEPIGGQALSQDRIRRLAMEKRRQYLLENEEKPMKKNVFRLLLVAAILCVTSVTVFAATGGLDYIRRIFGDSALSIQNEIVTPHVTATADGRQMAVEAMVTDGYVTNIVLSLTGSPPSLQELFQVSGDVGLSMVSYQPMEEISASGKTYYLLSLVSESRFASANVTVSLNPSVAPIDLPFSLDNRLGNAAIAFPQGAMSETVLLKELQISPMGFLLTGVEEDAKGGLPSTHITVVFSGGATESIEAEFQDDDSTVTGGGGAVITGGRQPAPLVVTYHGTRNPDGEIVVTGQFSRIIDPHSIEKVVIGGEEYPVS